MTTSEDTTALIAEAQEWWEDHRHGYQDYAGGPTHQYPGVELVKRLADRLAALTAPQEGDATEVERLLGELEDYAEDSTGAAYGTLSARLVIQYINDIRVALAALDRAPEPEWEWGAALVDDPSEATAHADKEAALKNINGWNESVARIQRMGRHSSGPSMLVRRRPAGPWLPVVGKSSGE